MILIKFDMMINDQPNILFCIMIIFRLSWTFIQTLTNLSASLASQGSSTVSPGLQISLSLTLTWFLFLLKWCYEFKWMLCVNFLVNNTNCEQNLPKPTHIAYILRSRSKFFLKMSNEWSNLHILPKSLCSFYTKCVSICKIYTYCVNICATFTLNV